MVSTETPVPCDHFNFFYYRYYDFLIATEPMVPCDHFEIVTITIMTVLTVIDEHVHHILPDMNHRIVAMSNTTDGCN